MQWVIDSEYIHESRLTTVQVDGKTLRFYPLAKFYFGIYNPERGFMFKENFDICDTFNFIFEQDPESSIQVYAFFNTAELSVHQQNFYDKLTNYGINLNKIVKKGKSYILFLEKEDKKLQFLDIMHVSGAVNLDEFCNLYLRESPKDYLRSLNVKHDENLVNNLTFDQLMEYNKRDCMMTYEAYQAFIQYMRDFIHKNFHVNLDTKHLFTLGSFASRILRELEKTYSGNILSIFAKYKQTLNKNINAYNSELEELINIGLQSYMGGGIILNFCPPRSKFEHAYMYDVVSLYPISALLMSQIAPSLVRDIQRSNESLSRFLDDYTLDGLVYAKLKLKNSSILPYAGMKANTHAYQLNLFYPKTIQRWFTFTELRVLLKDYEILQEDRDQLTSFSNKYTYFWQNTRNLAIYTYFDTLLAQKVKIDKHTDPINYNLNKLLLNIAYGKLVEKEKEKEYFPKLFTPILGSYLTSISRSIMYLIHQLTSYQTKHFATDSLIIPNQVDTDLVFTEVKNRFKEFKREFPAYYTKLMSSEIENEEINIIKCKQYFNTHKEAHHAIHAPKGKAYEILRLLMESKFNVVRIQRNTWETYTRLTDLIERHKKSMNLLNYAFLYGLEEQVAFYNFDTYFTQDLQAFDSIEEAKKYKHEVQKRRQTLKRNILKGVITANIKFFEDFRSKKPKFYDIK
jgi:hypothetical protein